MSADSDRQTSTGDKPTPQAQITATEHEQIQWSIVRSMLRLVPPSTSSFHSRDSRLLLSLARTAPLPLVYDKILTSEKLTNRELFHFLSVIGRYPRYLLSDPDGPSPISHLISLRFPSHDKYLPQLALVYFSLVNQLLDHLSQEQLLEVFSRYLHLFDNSICCDISLYGLFSVVLRRGLLDTFLFRGIHSGFPFLKEFIVDFSEAGNRLVRVGYSCPEARELAYSVLRLRETEQRDIHTDWLLQRWMPTGSYPYTISKLFYLYDCSFYMEDLSLRRFEAAVDILGELKRDFAEQGYSLPEADWPRGFVLPVDTGSRCMNRLCGQTGPSSWASSALARKEHFRAAVAEFNKTEQLPERLPEQPSENTSLPVSWLRISPLTDLTKLGSFLCKLKNESALLDFSYSFSFQGRDLLEALRAYFLSFWLVGESQIIDRVVRAFTRVWLDHNPRTGPTAPDYYREIVYSFVVINTMLHNPSAEKKPQFDDYLRMIGHLTATPAATPTGAPLLGTEELRYYYNSIRESQIRYPLGWEDSYDAYLFSVRLRDEEGLVRQDSHCCPGCIIQAYRLLFGRSYKNFYFLEPGAFFSLCRLLTGDGRVYEEFIAAHAENTPKALGAFRHYLENYRLDGEVYVWELLNVLSRVEKPRGSLLHDIKSLFSTSRTDLSTMDSRERVLSLALPSMAAALQPLTDLVFSDAAVCQNNLRVLATFYKARTEETEAISGLGLLRQLLVCITVCNASLIADLSCFPEPLRSQLVTANHAFIRLLPEAEQLTFLKSKQLLDSDDYAHFRNIRVVNSNSFSLFCRFQYQYGLFDEAVTILRQPGSFTYTEKYPDQLRDPKNILRLFTTSRTVLNHKFLRALCKAGCPLDSLGPRDYDRLAYMVLKCNSTEAELLAYSLRVLSCLGGSLALLCELYSWVYPVFGELSVRYRDSILAIFTAGLRHYKAGQRRLCCEQHSGQTEAEPRLGELYDRLASDGFIESEGALSGASDVVEL